jgi:curved DNA-binding protein CbpA
MSLYETLGLTPQASHVEIKAAWRKLAQKYHPDREGGDIEKFKEIEAAYAILSNVAKKRKYDETGQTTETTPFDLLVKGNLAQLLTQVVEHGDPEHTNLRKKMEEALDVAKRAVLAQQTGARALQKKWYKTLKLLGPPDVDDILQGTAHQKLEGCAKVLASCENELLVLAAMREALTKYDYNDVKREAPSPFFSNSLSSYGL